MASIPEKNLKQDRVVYLNTPLSRDLLKRFKSLATLRDLTVKDATTQAIHLWMKENRNVA